jgi:hypothetical protein
MSSLTKRSLLILFAMIVLVAIPMSFAADVDSVDDVATVDDAVDVVAADAAVDDVAAVDDAADVVAAADAKVDDIAAVDDAKVDDVAASDEPDENLESTPVPDNGAFVYIQNDEKTIDEGNATQIQGSVDYSYGAGGHDKLSDGAFPVTVSYTDFEGESRSYDTTASSGTFSFDTASFVGLKARDTPYIMTVSASDDSSSTAQMYTGSSSIASATFSLTVNAVAAPEPQPSFDDVVANITAAQEGDVIDLGTNIVYDANATVVNIDKRLTIVGNNVTIRSNGGGTKDATFVISAAGTVIRGINFENNENTLGYDEPLNGIAITVKGTNDVLIENCIINNYNKDIFVSASNAITIRNCTFGGVTTHVTPKHDKTEAGTYGIGIGSSSFDVLVDQCNFLGSMLDGLSAYQNSHHVNITNCYFENNTYAIFYGGAATKGSVIYGNTFKNCGFYDANGIKFDDLAVINCVKSNDGYKVINNTFYARNGNVLITGEIGNTQHGGFTAVGAIQVTGNKVLKLTDDVAPSSVIMYYLKSTNGAEFRPTETVDISNNDVVPGMRVFEYWSTEWGDQSGDVVIKKADPLNTFIIINAIENGTITGVLKDENDDPVTSEIISYSIAGGEKTNITTNKNDGSFVISNVANSTVSIVFAGVDLIGASELNVTVPAIVVIPEPEPVQDPVTTSISAANLNIKAGDSGTFKVTLKADGKALAEKNVVIIIDGVKKTVKTDANGVATLAVKYAAAGTYNAVVSFASETGYTSAINTAKITVTKKATALKAAKTKYTYKVKAAKKVVITLKSGKNPIKGKKVTLTVKGKTFSGKTNAKGQVTFKVTNLKKKGTYKFTAKFAGDSAYSAAKAVSGKIVVKK